MRDAVKLFCEERDFRQLRVVVVSGFWSLPGQSEAGAGFRLLNRCAGLRSQAYVLFL